MTPTSSPAGRNTGTPCPESATHPLVAACGFLSLIFGVIYVYKVRPFSSIAYNATVIIVVTSLGVFLPDLLWQRVWKRPTAGLGRQTPQGSWPRSLVKFAGLLGSMGFIAALYWLFPEYDFSPDSFYANYVTFLRLIVPVWLIVALPYIYLVDQRMDEPEDRLWKFGRFVTFHWEDIEGKAIGQHLLGWIVKGFFLPLMFTYMCDGLTEFLQYDFTKITDFGSIYDFSYFFIYFIDVCIGSMTYLVTLRLTDTHIHSTEPTMLGWAVTLVCYQPFWSFFGRQYFLCEETMNWNIWLGNYPFFHGCWGTAILALTILYLSADVAFGGRISNLTHRGIITSGPYRYTKHPAYLFKNLSWWLISVPFIVNQSTAVSLRNCLLLISYNGVYYIRAKTEERHLSLDPVYVEYSQWIDEHGLFRWINQIPFVRRLAQWKLVF